MRQLALAVAMLLSATGCAERGLTLLGEADLPPDVYGPPTPTPEPEEFPAEGTIYLISGSRLHPARVKLQPVLNSLEEALLVALFEEQESRRLSTAVPEGTLLNGVEVAGGIATVDVSVEFERAAPPRSQALRIAQVVFTLTEPETGVQAIRFQIDGVPQEAIGGEELGTIPGPVTRADYEHFAPRPARAR